MMFNQWSIRKLLRLWATATIVAVMIIAAVSLYSNLRYAENQRVLIEQVLPLEDNSRQISSISAAFVLRQQQILNAVNETQLEQVIDRNTLETDFEHYWQRLSQSSHKLNSGEALVDELYQHYQQFLLLDTQLSALMSEKLLLAEQINEQQAIVDELEARSLELVARLSLIYQPLAERVRVQMSAQLQTVSFALLKLTADIRALIHTAVNSSADVDSLILSTQTSDQSLQSAIQSLEQAGSGLDVLAELSEHRVSLAATSLGADNGISRLRQLQVENSQQLGANQRQISALLEQMSADLSSLSRAINHYSLQTVDRSSLIADSARGLIIGLTILVVLAMFWFSLTVSNRIAQPLNRLREAMHALSSKQFDTRLTAQTGAAEFNLLAKDFNQFAENNQTLINDLAEAKHSLQVREQHIRAILNGVPEAILTLNNEGMITACNPAVEKVLHATEQQLVGQPLSRFLDGTAALLMPEKLHLLQKKHREFDGYDFNGDVISMWLSLSPVSSIDGDLWVCVISDITDWKETRLQLQQRTSELDAILENAMVGIAFIKDRHLIRVNHKFEQLFGCSRAQIEGESAMYLHPSLEAFVQFGENAYSALAQGEDFEAQVEMVRMSGQRFWCAVAGKAIDPESPAEGSIWLFEDVTKQRENEERLTRLANADVLTGLPNRAVFNDRLEHAIHKAHRNSGRLAVFFLDLDHFKHINDSLGHKVGDMLLCEVAKRIRSCVREGDTVARLGGDEFTVILEDVRSAQYVGKVAEKILNTAALPYLLDGTEVNISPSIGISLYPADGRDVDMLIRNADAAMYHAKNSGRNNFQFYSADMNAEAAQRLALETSLRRAVEQNEFYLHFQPQIDLDSGRISGAEVLLRWHTEHWGEVSPSRFVPLLEDTGLINTVGEWVLRETCRQFVESSADLPDDFVMAVNLSGRQFKGGHLARYIQNLLLESGMSAKNLELEITESLLMDDTELAIDTLRQLSALGVTLAIDDFGTGYSSLSYLKQFPLNVLKIDRTFVSDVTDDKDDAAIVNAILAMSESLDLEVVAEGVETAEQLAFLRAQNCKRAQGYLFSRPVPIEELMQLVDKRISLPQTVEQAVH
ncbi:EAL domain-containing protein [Methylophaga lonarensis]|nr:EAL domain-containing protein [Methylophaga lonarensis]